MEYKEINYRIQFQIALGIDSRIVSATGVDEAEAKFREAMPGYAVISVKAASFKDMAAAIKAAMKAN